MKKNKRVKIDITQKVKSIEESARKEYESLKWYNIVQKLYLRRKVILVVDDKKFIVKVGKRKTRIKKLN